MTRCLMMSVCVLIVGIAFGCAAESLECATIASGVRQNRVITMRVNFSVELFLGLNALELFDDADLVLLDSASRTPSYWQTSKDSSLGCDPGSQAASGFGPVIVHPSVVTSVTRKAILPAYICGTAAVYPDHKFSRETVRGAVTSNCVPVPKEYGDMSIEDAAEFLPPESEFLAPIDIYIDTRADPELVTRNGLTVLLRNAYPDR
ncbi:MAG: hypothetical protein A2341_23445 [Deltaproteobacteria bacterium RIFOXYB12_FULL_58_9]|nr:MAG: hypothetical protein A2341_23445 [Deltaproteobacteria bacterium RIFOXYB12_FULL_58_9]